MFTLTDKTLLDRVARMVKEMHREHLQSQCPPAGWGANEKSKAAKLVYDRLVRDERDLRALGKRMMAHFAVPDVEPPAILDPTVGPPARFTAEGFELAFEPSISEQREMGVGLG